jgi:hypothetical protein
MAEQTMVLLPEYLNSQNVVEGNLDIVSERSGTVVPLKISKRQAGRGGEALQEEFT